MEKVKDFKPRNRRPSVWIQQQLENVDVLDTGGIFSLAGLSSRKRLEESPESPTRKSPDRKISMEVVAEPDTQRNVEIEVEESTSPMKVNKAPKIMQAFNQSFVRPTVEKLFEKEKEESKYDDEVSQIVDTDGEHMGIEDSVYCGSKLTTE